MNDALLADHLAIAVPMWIEKLASTTFDYRARRAHECAQVIGHKGDIILYRSPTKGETAEAFNRLAEGIACAAFQPGGIKCFGHHFEALDRTAARRQAAEEFWGGHTCPGPCALCVTLARIDGSYD